MRELELVRCGVRAAVVFSETVSSRQEAGVDIDGAHSSLQQVISEDAACEMAMSSWCVQRAGRVVVVVAGRDDAHVDHTSPLTGFPGK